MNQTVYYFGAGASFQSLPLVKTMNVRMESFSIYLKMLLNQNQIKSKFASDYIKYLDKIIENNEKNTSIDSYAKQLFIAKDFKNLTILKCILSGYLAFEQLNKPDKAVFHYNQRVPGGSFKKLEPEIQKSIMNILDKRYKTFWSDILDIETNSLPVNVNIISWNYDLQLETAYGEILKCGIEDIQDKLNVTPPKTKVSDVLFPSIVKLNGSAGLVSNDGIVKSYFDFNKHYLLEEIENLIYLLEANINRTNLAPHFYYSFEENEITKYSRHLACSIVSISSILVVIGYSFPPYNKRIDEEIFKNNNIKKVYIQCLKDEFNEIAERLSLISGIQIDNICLKQNLDTFFIPYELN